MFDLRYLSCTHVASGGVVRHVKVWTQGLESVALEEGNVGVKVVKLRGPGDNEELHPTVQLRHVYNQHGI